MASPPDWKPPPPRHLAAARRATGPGQETRTGHVPAARPDRRRRDFVASGGTGGAPGQGPQLRVAAEPARGGHHPLRKHGHVLRAVRRVLEDAAQALHVRAAQHTQGAAACRRPGQRDPLLS